MSNQVEQIVRQYCILPNKPAPSGWYAVRCLVCNDHKHKKRGGWKFDGNKASYHCFNCSTAVSYDEESGFVSDDLKKVLDAVGVPDTVITELKFDSFKRYKESKFGGEARRSQFSTNEIKPIQLPKHFYRLIQDEDDVWSQIAQEYLLDRGIDIDDYKFYLSRGGDKTENKWKGRLIIPYYNNDNLIFYHGRDLTGKSALKYLGTEAVSKASVMYGLDQLHTNRDQPLFVVEGFFDAFHIKGVAVFGNEMSEHQIALLNSSSRQKVIIPDRRGNGHLLALKGLEMGWNVSNLPFDYCKDVNEAVQQYGLLYVFKSIMDNIKSGFEAEVHTRLLCEK